MGTILAAIVAAGLAGAVEPATQVIEARCVRCHNPGQKKGGLDLTTRDALLRGGDSGSAVQAGDARSSLLYRLVAHIDEPAMPRKARRLGPDEVARVAAWIDAGAPYERTLVASVEQTHWAWRPLGRFAVGTTIDRLVRAKLAAAGLTLARPIGRRALVRRVSFDLLGLPPAPKDIDAFLGDRAPGAYGRLIDSLLASPHHGERWGRHWLDVARYADSAGYEHDRDRPTAHAYRDFVIRALNADMPFDRFLAWQLAGDELEPDDPDARAATGFLAVGPAVEVNPTETAHAMEKYRYDELDDLVSTTGAAFLGLTLGCARCHDHKFDPISSRDYYQLVAAFITSKRHDIPLGKSERELEELVAAARAGHRERRMAELAVPEGDRALLRLPLVSVNGTQKRVWERWNGLLEISDRGLRESLPEDHRIRWTALERAVAVEKHGGPSPRALTVTDRSAEPVSAFLLGRGEPGNKIEPVGFGFLSALGSQRGPASYLASVAAGRSAPARTTLRRAALAAWMTDTDNGAGALVARVMVNRLWQHHFGRGLADAPNDFGTQTPEPRQADVLDFLAGELVRAGWRLRPIHRLILSSAVYRQGTAFDARSARVDPDEQLLWRRRLVRLDAEALHDAMLAAGGALNRALYGPAVKPSDDPSALRRGIYLFAKRTARLPLLEIFDGPDGVASCGRRSQSTVPTQGLAVLNNPFVRARARDLAARILFEAGPRTDRQIDRAFLLTLGRPARPDEQRQAVRFLGAQSHRRETEAAVSGRAIQDRIAALTDLAQALFTSNELMYVE